MRTAFAIAAAAFMLAACGGGGQPSSMVQPPSVNQPLSRSAAMEARASAMESQANAILARTANAPGVNNAAQQEDDENIWESVAEAYELLAQAERIRTEAAKVAGNDEAVEAWTIAAAAADAHASVARRLAAGNSPLTQVARKGTIATFFGATKLDHDPLNVSFEHHALYWTRLAIEAWKDAVIATERAEYLDSIGETDAAEEARIDAIMLTHYAQGAAGEAALEITNLDPTCCWKVAKEESEIASRAEVYAMLEENAFSVPSANGPIERSIRLHASPPTIRFLSDQSAPVGRAATLRAIDYINAWLPYNKHIIVGEDFSRVTNESKESNDIIVDLYGDLIGGVAGFSDFTIGKQLDGKWYSEFDYSDGLIRHELLHALGMNGGKSGYIKL